MQQAGMELSVAEQSPRVKGEKVVGYVNVAVLPQKLGKRIWRNFCTFRSPYGRLGRFAYRLLTARFLLAIFCVISHARVGVRHLNTS